MNVNDVSLNAIKYEEITIVKIVVIIINALTINVMREIKTANILLRCLNEYPNDTRLIIEVKIAKYTAYFVKIDKETLILNIFNL